MRLSRCVLLAAALLIPGCVYAPLDLGLDNLGKELEVVVHDADAREKIFLLRVDGEIGDHGDSGLFVNKEGTVAFVKQQLEVAKNDPDVKALLLRIDSPGGGVTASDVIYRELVEWKRETGRPIVAVFMDTACSGGFYIAQAADHVLAHPTTITGSIGVISLLPNVAGLGEKIGVKVDAVTSGPLKDMGNPFRAVEPAERKVFQVLIDQMYQRFVDVVAEGRKRSGLTRAQVATLADGRVYTAEQALKTRLIDEIGYVPAAVKKATELAGVPHARVVTRLKKGLGQATPTIYSKAVGIPDAASILARGAGESSVRLEVPGLTPPRRPFMCYLWAPELR